MEADGIRLTDISDTNAAAFLPFVPESLQRLCGKASCRQIGVMDGDGLASGILVASYVKHWEIRWIYVAEECRRRGMGLALLNGLSHYYSRSKSGETSAYVTEVMDHKALVPLFRKAGYSIEEGWGGAYFETELENVDSAAFGGQSPRHAIAFGSMTSEQLRGLNRWLSAREGKKQVPLPLETEEYEPYSHIGWEGGRAAGACLVRKNARGLQVVLLHVEKGRTDILAGTISGTLKEMKEACPGTMRIGALAVNDISRKLCRKLAGEAEEYGAYKAVLHLGA